MKKTQKAKKESIRVVPSSTKPSLTDNDQTTATSSSLLKWPITNDPPDRNAFVTAIFWGLMGFCYNINHEDLPVCEVGFHPGNGHRLEIKIFKRNPNCNQPQIITPNPTDKIALKIIGTFSDGLDFYQTTDNPFDRLKTGGNNEFDFRWLPDLDGPDFYPENYSKNQRYTTRLFVSHGTFYTRVRTGSKFKLVDAATERDLRPFGHVARFMAAAINPQESDFVRLEINNVTVKDFVRETGVTYQILFKNECNNCSFDPNHPNDETRRNDFHFNRKAVMVPAGVRTKYGLKIDGPAGESDSDFCETGAQLTDEAPCMGTGYGQTPEFPPPPQT